MSKRMMALCKEKAQPGFTLREIDVPLPGPGDLLVRVRRATICGSDIQCYAWSAWAAKVFTRFPLVLGHEFGGDVVAVGDQVTRFKEGDRVAGETHIPCGNCLQCLTGDQHICQRMELLGHTVDGCFAEYCVVPEKAARRIPDSLSYDDAALLEPLGVAVRPSVDGGSVTGASAVVMGCGAIGLMTIAVLRASGAFPIIGIDPIEPRRALAAQMGADDTFDAGDRGLPERVIDLTGGDGADIIVDASGATEAIQSSLGCLRKGGRYFMLGMPKQNLEVNVARDFIFKEIRLFGVHGRRMFASWRVAERLLLGGRINLAPVVGKHLRLEAFEEAFGLLKDGAAVKVMFDISDGDAS